MDFWLKTKIVGFIRNLIKKEQEEKNYIESQDLFGEEIYQMQNKENPKTKKSFVLKLFDNNRTINRRNSYKYSSSTQLIKDIKIFNKNSNNYFRRHSDSKLPIITNAPPKEILIQTFEQEKNNILFKVIGYLLTLLKHYLEIYIPKHKAAVITSITKHKTYEEFWLAFKYYIFYLIIFTLLTNMQSWIQQLLIYIFSIKDTSKNKNIMLENVLHKDMEFFDKNKIADIHNDLKAFQKGPVNINLVEMLTQLVLYGTKFLYICFFLYKNFYELFCIYIIINLIKATNNKISSYKKNSKICETLQKQRENKLLDILNNIKLIKLFNAEDKELDKVYEIDKNIENTKNRKNMFVKFFEDLNKSYLEAIQTMLQLHTLGKKILKDKMNYGDIIIFENYCKELNGISKKIPDIYKNIKKVLNDWKNFFKIYDIETKIFSIHNIIPYSINFNKPLIEFKNITFNYPSINVNDPNGKNNNFKTSNAQNINDKVNINTNASNKTTNNYINNISFKLEKDETIVIHGKKNSGKTTLINLLERLYEPNDGNIYFKGYELKSLNLKWLRNNIGYVSHEPSIINGTFKENILYGISKDEKINNRYIDFICRFLKIDDYIPLVNGYDTIISEFNQESKLTKGQQKLILLGRVLIKKPKILVFDEILDDLSNEIEIQKNIKLCIEKIIEEKNLIFPNIDGIIIITNDYSNNNLKIKGVDKIISV
jgi:ABC-type multidrug transport system fused ATPase/permease subunit